MTERRNRHEDFIRERRQADRRAHARHRVAITIELTAGNDLYFHVSGDLSQGGAFFDRAIPHPIGTHVQLTFQLPGDDPRPIRCSGEVANIPDGGDGLGMGVRFLDVSESDQARIEAFAEQVAALAAAEAEAAAETAAGATGEPGSEAAAEAAEGTAPQDTGSSAAG